MLLTSIEPAFSYHHKLEIRTITRMKWLQITLAVVHKDVTLELRSKYALNTVLAFVISALLVVLFSLRADELAVPVQSGLLWIIVLFAALSSLARAFVSEAERNTFDLLRLHAPALAVYTGKLLFNYGFTLIITSISLIAFIFMLSVEVHHLGLLILVLLLGTLGLSGVSTLLGAIVSQAERKGTIFSVISLPLLVPLVLLLVRTTQAALHPESTVGLLDDMLAMVGFAGVTITASVLLFEFIWED